MLATLVDQPFDGPEWLFEIKWDGFRTIAQIKKKKVDLYSRNLVSFTELFTPIQKTLSKLNFDAVLDGEVVVVDDKGKSHFQLLQNYNNTGEGAGRLIYFVFDILYLDGRDLRGLPLIERKEILKKILPKTKNVRYSDHVLEHGKKFYQIAQKQDLEGIIAKKTTSTYQIGRRTMDWLKIKLHHEQEAVIVGFTEPKGGRKYFGALILGVYENAKLKYVGHTGGGFNEQLLKTIHGKLKPLVQKVSAFETIPKTNAPATWVKPKLIAQVKFAEWTGDGHMRQPIFIGLRTDKKPTAVSKELPKDINPKSMKTSGKKNSEDRELKINSNLVKITHWDKVYWPKEKITKGQVIEYYRKISKYILPYLKNRPESLNRHPHGIDGQSFFQKDVGDMPPKWVKTHKVFSESNNKHLNYLICQDEATLVYMANLGCIEINPWNSHIGSLDKPDYLIVDLDPEDISFDKVVEAAQVTHEVLNKLKVPSYCKTSGATGLHIYIPLGAKYTYDQAKQFTQLVVTMVHNRLPNTTSLERRPIKRQKKVYLDFLQNRRGQTLAAAYSIRPKAGATVSTPLDWKEVKKGLSPKNFTMFNIFDRLKKKSDLWKPVLGKGVDLKKVLARLENSK